MPSPFRLLLTAVFVIWLPAAGAAEPAGQPRPALILDAHTKAITCLAFSGDGSLLATGSKDETVRLWDARSFKVMTVLPGHKEMAACVAFSPDGKTLASGSHDREIRLWKVPGGKPVGSLHGHKNEVRALAFSGDGVTLFSGSADYTIKAWDLKSGRTRWSVPAHTDEINALALAQDQKTLASAAWDRTVRLRDPRDGKRKAMLIGHEEMVRVVLFQPKGDLIASSDKNGLILIWDQRGKLHRRLEGHEGLVRTMSFHPGGKLLASGSKDGTMKLWSMATFQPVAVVKGDGRDFQVLAFAPDGKTLATGGVDGKLRLWDISRLLVAGSRTDKGAAVKPLTPVEARKKVGKEITVEMTVRAAKDRLENRGEIYLDSERVFRAAENFAVVITRTGAGSLREAGIDSPAEHFKDKRIRASGRVKEADGVPRIEIDDAKQIRVVSKK